MRSCLTFFYLLAVASASSRAAQAPSDAQSNSDASAAAAFGHFTVQRQGGPPWSLESIHIEASLPKLAKHASWNAIRRILPAGEPVYEHVEPAGDRMVTKELIARYV